MIIIHVKEHVLSFVHEKDFSDLYFGVSALATRPITQSYIEYPVRTSRVLRTYIDTVKGLLLDMTTCSRSRRRAANGSKRMYLDYTHGLFIT